MIEEFKCRGCDDGLEDDSMTLICWNCYMGDRYELNKEIIKMNDNRHYFSFYKYALFTIFQDRVRSSYNKLPIYKKRKYRRLKDFAEIYRKYNLG